MKQVGQLRAKLRRRASQMPARRSVAGILGKAQSGSCPRLQLPVKLVSAVRMHAANLLQGKAGNGKIRS